MSCYIQSGSYYNHLLLFNIRLLYYGIWLLINGMPNEFYFWIWTNYYYDIWIKPYMLLPKQVIGG